MKYPKYPAYKDSGVEWIGEIPEHWKVTELKRVCHFNYGDSLPMEARLEGKFPVFGSNGIIGYNNLTNTGSPTIIIGRKGSYGKLTYSSLSGFAIDTTFYVNEKTSRANLKWLYYALGILNLDKISLDTGVPGLSREDAYKKIIVLPNNDEQFLISNFLDYETIKIDGLISKTLKIIELLKEKRQAIITHAVTKGLDPNVPVKNSGVEWIGEIPEHWKLKRLKYVVKLVNEKCEQDTTRIALENIESWSGKYLLTDGEFKGDGIGFQTGDILFGKLRPYLAKVYLAAFSGAAVGDFFILRPFSDIEPNFLFNWLINREFINMVNSATYGAKMPRVDWGFMGELLVTIPPKEEQIKICDTINVKTSQIDALITKQYDMIEHLKEYKTSLISQAITGKIDVRGFAASTTSTNA